MEDLKRPFIQATINCFMTMMQVEPDVKDPNASFEIDPSHIVTSLDLVGGHLKIHTALCLSREAAQIIVETTLAEGSTVTEEELCDAIGEVINIIGGNVKGFLRDHQLDLTIPSTTSGNTSIESIPENLDRFAIAFDLPDVGEFTLFVGRESDED